MAVIVFELTTKPATMTAPVSTCAAAMGAEKIALLDNVAGAPLETPSACALDVSAVVAAAPSARARAPGVGAVPHVQPLKLAHATKTLSTARGRIRAAR
jgi:hypothetical protein